MAMPKKMLREWPWNNQPSKRHVWRLKSFTERCGAIETCDRCGRTFIEKADTRGPVYCYPTPEWLVANPGDDRKEG